MIVRLLDILPLVKNRFDVKIKYLYARDLESGITDSIFKDIYKEHLRVWNGFYEKDPLKTSFNEFDKSFKRTLKSIKEDGFVEHESLIPVDLETWYPVNGAHRLAACILYNKPVYLKLGDHPCERYNESFFRKRGLSEEIISIVKNESINND